MLVHPGLDWLGLDPDRRQTVQTRSSFLQNGAAFAATSPTLGRTRLARSDRATCSWTSARTSASTPLPPQSAVPMSSPFEPDPRNARTCTIHVRPNRVSRDARLVRVYLADKVEPIVAAERGSPVTGTRDFYLSSSIEYAVRPSLPADLVLKGRGSHRPDQDRRRRCRACGASRRTKVARQASTAGDPRRGASGRSYTRAPSVQDIIGEVAALGCGTEEFSDENARWLLATLQSS
jgi:hypothetical protein